MKTLATRYTSSLILAVLGVCSLGAAQAQTQSQPAASQPAATSEQQTVATGDALAPGQIFANPVMSVRSPNEAGWKMGVQTSVALSFVKPGVNPREDYAAQVMLFPIKDNLSKDEFVAYIKKGIDANSPPDRFKPIESKLTYTTQRGYPCVQFAGVTEDMKSASNGGGSTKLQVRSLYCHHPQDQGVGFMIAFMHRGENLDKGLPAKAEEFFKGAKAVVVSHEAAPAGKQSAPSSK